MALPYHLIALALAFVLFFNSVSSKKILEEGYTVSTVIDGHKLKINPHLVLSRPGSSDLLILDSSRSHLYTVSFPLSNESDVKRISSGEEKPGYQDGELSQARFDEPKSFAFDVKGNVYVADKRNHVIRKISSSGTVTTIAGGSSKTTGNKDGPSQNATFSNDFELAVVAERCMLLVADHGNQLVRRIDLKPADCTTSSPSSGTFGLQGVTIWILVLVFSCLLGMVMGILLHPYITRHIGSIQQRLRIQQDMEALPNQFGGTKSHSSLKDSVSLFDSDDLSGNVVKKSQVYPDQLKDLIHFDDNLDSLNVTESFSKLGDENQNRSNVLSDCHGRLDTMIQANVIGFANQAEETSLLVKPAGSSSVLVKRR